MSSKDAGREARQGKIAQDELRREKHLPVAVALRCPDQASEVIHSAMKQLSLWREQQLCSSDYIEAWEELLKDPAQAADVLESRESWAVQLRQNSPFVTMIRRIRTRGNGT